MGRCYYAKIIVLVIGVLMVHSAHSTAASDDAYQSVFIEHLEMGPATFLNIDAHGKTTADIDKRLTELYHGNRHRRFLNTANCEKSWPNIMPLPQKAAGRQFPQVRR